MMTVLTQNRNVFVSPCGTSILTNSTGTEMRNLLMQTANYKEKDLTPEQKQKIDQHIAERRQILLNSSTNLEVVKKLSAELNGIITYYVENLQAKISGTSDQHYLLVSDTYQGGKVGEMVADWLANRGMSVQTVNISDLATDNLETFRLAMSELINWCDPTLSGYREQGWHVVFNLTGGFKSVNGFLQAIGMFYAHESIYIFQFSSQLLRIPQLPITLDKEGIVDKHLETFRRLGLKQELPISGCVSIPETLLFKLGDRVALSEWGELVWLQSKSQYYQQQLLAPLSNKFFYSNQFEQQVNQLPADRLRIINERLDQLSAYFDSQGSYNPRSLDFKQLKGKPLVNSTHECDAWSDQDAKRIYGHFEGDGRYLIDELGKHI